MLTIDEMHACITTFLRDGGYEEGVWMPSPKYDSRVSNFSPVYGMTYSNNSVPMIPSASRLEITEGWINGDREVKPKIWLKDNNQTRIWYTEVSSEADLLQYMQSRFPTGQALVEVVNAATIASQATRLRAEQEIHYDNTVKECILDDKVKSLVDASVQAMVDRGLTLEIYPKLRERFMHHLSIKLRDEVARGFVE